MKKKFVLTLALVLMVAVALTAAVPVEVSGSFEFGYKFTFDDDFALAVGPNEQKVTTFVEVSADHWSLDLGAGGDIIGKDQTSLKAATLHILLDKALADEGVDMGDVSLTLHLGGVDGAIPSVFADAANFEEFGAEAATANLALSIGYGDLVDVYFAADPTTATGFEGVVGATVTPVDGVDVAAGYVFGSKTLEASVAADVKKLADLDFGLAVTAAYAAVLGDDVTSTIGADVKGTYEGATAYVGFLTDLDKHDLGAGISYKTTLEGFTIGAGANVKLTDLGGANKFGFDVNASAGYTMGGVAYNLKAEYKLDEAFTLTPSVKVTF